MANNTRWPALPLNDWRDTYATLHMWTQIVGKVVLALTPRTNHFWNAAFHFSPRGLSTQTIAYRDRSFAMTFNFCERELEIVCSDGASEQIALEPRTVADFYSEFTRKLERLGIEVDIWPMPVEVPEPIRFTDDTLHRSYDACQVDAFWQALLSMKPVFEEFRCGFVGKCSPLHFFWGSFDLAVSRFSGHRAPERPNADSVTREAYSHEVISHGFWPGSGPVQEAAFYAYAAPEPPGLAGTPVGPEAAYYHPDLHEFILPYDAVRLAVSPESELRTFLHKTYEAAANLAGWKREDLERISLIAG